MESLYADALHTLLGDLCTGARLRALQQDQGSEECWQALVESGFLNALLPEDAGGVGLDLAECLPVLLAAGYHALPLPFVDTLVIRAALGTADKDREAGIALADAGREPGRARLLQPALRGVQAVALAGEDDVLLHPVEAREGQYVTLGEPLQRFQCRPDTLVLGAFIENAFMAGAMQRLLEMTVSYANERRQFGRPIGKFQALQQQVSVMTGHCHSAVMAVNVAAGGAGFVDGRLQLDAGHVAAARTVICEAAQPVCDVAHAVHGAIGVTGEYDLQLWTQRVLAGRRSHGADSYWAQRLGATCLAGGHRLYQTVQAQLAPAI